MVFQILVVPHTQLLTCGHRYGVVENGHYKLRGEQSISRDGSPVIGASVDAAGWEEHSINCGCCEDSNAIIVTTFVVVTASPGRPMFGY